MGSPTTYNARLVLALMLFASQGIAAESTATPEDVKATFVIDEYRVLGNTVLKPIDIEQVVYPLLGSHKTIDDVEKARAALEARYHELGYSTVFVDIPEQNVAEGVVRLKVTEGKLGQVRVIGTKYFSNREIRDALPAASKDAAPHIPTLQAQLTQLNAETPDRVVTPVLKAGATPGTVDLALNVEDHLPFHGSVELNNQYTADTSKLRALVSASYDNLFNRLDSISAQYQTAPERSGEADVFAASYTARLTQAGSKLAAYFIKSNSDVAAVGEAGSTVGVIGQGKIYGLRFISPLEATQEASHAFIGGVEYKDFTDSVFSSQFLQTPISYVNFSAGHMSAWREPKTQWSLGTTVNFGVRGVQNDPEEFRVARFRGVANYFFVRGDGSVAAALPWKLALRLRAAGQYAVDPIISHEQFSIAGADGVRGYLEAEQLGDVGIKGSAELGSPRWSWFTDQLQTDVFAFFDYGRMTRLDPLRAQDPKTLELGELLERPNITLRSVGMGMNLIVVEHFSGALAWAYPLVDSGTARGTRSGDSRIHFSVRATW